MKVNQISQGFPQYLSHKCDYLKEKPIFHRKVEFNIKRNTHQNIFSDQYHIIPFTQDKNPFLRQEFNIGEAKKQWQKLVEEKVLPPIKVYDCVLDTEQVVPRETIVLKNKNLYPQYYYEALNESGKIGFRRQSGAFMQQASEINKIQPILDQFKTPQKRHASQTLNEPHILGSNNNLTIKEDMSIDKQQKNYQYQSRPSLLRQSMLMESTNFFTPNFKNQYDESKEEEKRNRYLKHDPTYINEVEHSMNKQIISDSIKPKSKSILKLHRDLKGQFELKSMSNNLESTPKLESYYSLEKVNDLKRSVEFQNFEDELTKFENSLKSQKKKNTCAWMKNNCGIKGNGTSQFFSSSSKNQSNHFQNSESMDKNEFQDQLENNSLSMSQSNLYNIKFKPVYIQSTSQSQFNVENQQINSLANYQINNTNI